MSKSVSFSEATQNFANDVEAYSGQDEDEALEGTQDRQFNKFELLGLVEGADQDDLSISDRDSVGQSDADEEEEEAKPRTKQDKSTNQSTQASISSSKRKPRKKRGKKGFRSKDKDLEVVENEVDTLEKAVVLHSSANHKLVEDLRFKMLKVDMRNLIPELEIKRMFGKSVVREDKNNRIRQHPGSNLQRSRFVSAGYFETKSSGSPSGPRMDLDETMNNVRRTDLQHTTGYDPKLHNNGLGESSSAIFNSGEPIYFKFTHDKSYQEAQRMFLEAVNQGSPESVVQNLTIAPFHAESLVQLSHMVRVSEDFKTASEFIERSLIVFERGFHPRFNLATASCRLTYKRPENRTFFITIFKHIDYCHRRGLRRTPFEYSKLLLSLEPENDPLQAIQLIDFFALRSEDYDYVIDFYQKWDRSQKLPNISFSTALAHFMKSQGSKLTKEKKSKNLCWADEFLQKALTTFPNFIVPLLEACSGEPSGALKECAYFDYSVYGTNYKLVPETVEVLINLYVKRAYSLWKQKPVMAWLERNVEIMVNKFKSGELTDERRQVEHWRAFPKVVPKNLLRHIVLCDLDMKIPASASGSSFLDIDPYPPTDSLVSYDSSRQTSLRENQNEGGSLIGNLGGLFLRSFLPSFSMNDQQQQLGPTANQLGSQNLQSTSGRHQNSNNQTEGTDNAPGSRITMADYVLDEDEDDDDVAAARRVGRAPAGNHFDEVHGTIRELAAAVTNLLNLQPSIRSHQERQQDQSDRAEGEENRPDNDENRRNGDQRNP